MNVLNLLNQRYTTKAYCPSATLPQETVDMLLESLRLSPSSVNSQPWHFMVAASPEAKERIRVATDGAFAFNTPKIRDASHVIVLCSRFDLTDAYLEHLVDQEHIDGRYAHEQALQSTHQTRLQFIHSLRNSQNLERWTEKQTYIALGFLLLSAAMLNVDATPIEGFDVTLLDQSLNLKAHGLSPQVIVALGQRSDDDSNRALPKSRLPAKEVFTYL